MQQSRFQDALACLTDGQRTTVVLVTRPDRAALREVERTAHELDALISGLSTIPPRDTPPPPRDTLVTGAGPAATDSLDMT